MNVGDCNTWYGLFQVWAISGFNSTWVLDFSVIKHVCNECCHFIREMQSPSKWMFNECWVAVCCHLINMSGSLRDTFMLSIKKHISHAPLAWGRPWTNAMVLYQTHTELSTSSLSVPHPGHETFFRLSPGWPVNCLDPGLSDWQVTKKVLLNNSFSELHQWTPMTAHPHSPTAIWSNTLTILFCPCCRVPHNTTDQLCRTLSGVTAQTWNWITLVEKTFHSYRFTVMFLGWACPNKSGLALSFSSQ